MTSESVVKTGFKVMAAMAGGGILILLVASEYEPTPNVLHVIGGSLYGLSMVVALIFTLVAAILVNKERNANRQ